MFVLPPSHVSAVRVDELQSIKRELSQIKIKVDDLLDSLERMEKDHSKKSGRRFCINQNAFQFLFEVNR